MMSITLPGLYGNKMDCPVNLTFTRTFEGDKPTYKIQDSANRISILIPRDWLRNCLAKHRLITKNMKGTPPPGGADTIMRQEEFNIKGVQFLRCGDSGGYAIGNIYLKPPESSRLRHWVGL